jgi:hypothetical protein
MLKHAITILLALTVLAIPAQAQAHGVQAPGALATMAAKVDEEILPTVDVWDEPSRTFAGEYPTTWRHAPALVDLAREFWQARDVEPCASPQVMEAPSLFTGGSDATGRALQGDPTRCKMWLHASWLRDTKAESWRNNDNLRVYMGAVVVHEMGHLGGLDHSDGGLMDAGVGAEGFPWECRQWVRELDRPARAAAKRAERKRKARAAAKRRAARRARKA